jgi:hypothetical protein
MYVNYPTLLHLPPLRFHGVGGCRDRTQDNCVFRIGGQTLYPLGYISSKTSVAYLLCGHQADLPLVNVPQDADALFGEGGHQGVPRHSQQVSLIKCTQML